MTEAFFRLFLYNYIRYVIFLCFISCKIILTKSQILLNSCNSSINEELISFNFLKGLCILPVNVRLRFVGRLPFHTQNVKVQEC